ncbi:LOW QUALITY PROTEIN: putative E3 ubiquitin-protein ligase MARCHF10 [Alca torda]
MLMKQTFTNESSEFERGSVIKSSGNRPGLKFPIIENVSVKQKLKRNSFAYISVESPDLLAKDSEEEGDQCRICQIAGGSPTNPLLEPCGCVGSLQFVHQECKKKKKKKKKTTLKAKIKSGADLEAVKTCELHQQNLIIDVDNFNVNAYYRNHQQSRWKTAISDLE